MFNDVLREPLQVCMIRRSLAMGADPNGPEIYSPNATGGVRVAMLQTQMAR